MPCSELYFYSEHVVFTDAACCEVTLRWWRPRERDYKQRKAKALKVKTSFDLWGLWSIFCLCGLLLFIEKILKTYCSNCFVVKKKTTDKFVY